MNNLIVSVYLYAPELGELVSDASTSPLVEIQMEPYYEGTDAKVWLKEIEHKGSTYRLFACHMSEDVPEEENEPDQELIDVYKKYALDDEGNVPNKRVVYRCEHQEHCKLYHAQGVEIEPEEDVKKLKSLLRAIRSYTGPCRDWWTRIDALLVPIHDDCTCEACRTKYKE